jgi:hypothetical protein
MAVVKPHEAEHFYEEDEDPAEVFALFDAGRKRQTKRPGPPGSSRSRGALAVVRRAVATALRRVADVIEPPRVVRSGNRQAGNRPH